jgi:hypothetical protein
MEKAKPAGGKKPKETAINTKMAMANDPAQRQAQYLGKVGGVNHHDKDGNKYESDAWQGDGTSIFDPVLTEIAYRWFCPAGGSIIDPFAGGSVRGIVAAYLGFKYTGVDLAAPQIAANYANAKEVLENKEMPVWHCGNSLNIDEICKGMQADLIFSCPPYHDLEVYSEDPEDISTMPYPEFLQVYQVIIKKAIDLLKPDRFACFVVADVRDANGLYKNFVSDTIAAFQACGAMLYNEIILVNVAGSLPIRAGRQFNNSRKVGKMHQNVLVFYKGSPKKIKENFPELDFSSLAFIETGVTEL